MDDAGIYARESSYLGRYVQIGVAGQKVISLSFPADPDADAEADHDVLDRIFAYLEGVEDDFADVDVGLTIPTDRRNVLESVAEIPYGEEVSVDYLLRMTPGLDATDEDAQDLARAALAENPVPLLVPDHRVRDGPSGAPASVEQKLRSLEGL